MLVLVWPAPVPVAKQGISNSAINIQRQEHIRLRRALTLDSDTGQLLVVNYSTEAAEAQARRTGCFFRVLVPVEIRVKVGARSQIFHPPTSNGKQNTVQPLCTLDRVQRFEVTFHNKAMRLVMRWL